MWTLTEELKKMFVHPPLPRLKIILGETVFPEELSVIIMKLVLVGDSYCQKCVVRSVCRVWRQFVLQYSPRPHVMLCCTVVSSSNTCPAPIGIAIVPTRADRIRNKLQEDVARKIPLNVLAYVLTNNKWISPEVAVEIYTAALKIK